MTDHSELPRTRTKREVELENRVKKLEGIIAEAEKVTSVIQMRTHYSGNLPYSGWVGQAQALMEALDDRDSFKIALEEIREAQGSGTWGKVAGAILEDAFERRKKKG